MLFLPSSGNMDYDYSISVSIKVFLQIWCSLKSLHVVICTKVSYCVCSYPLFWIFPVVGIIRDTIWSLILCSEDMSMIFFLVPKMYSSFAFWLAKWPELGQKAMSDIQTQAWNYRITEQLPRLCEWLSKGQNYEQHYLWLSEWFDIQSLSSFVRRLVLSKLCQAKDYLKNDVRQAQYTVKK